MDDENKLLENILQFIRLLRKSGIKIGNQSSIDALNSIKILNIGNRNEFYWALHSNLINKNEDTEIFDQCFYLFWQNPKILEQMFNLLLPQIGTQKAPKADKKQLKRISDNIQKQNKDIEKEKKDEILFDAQMSWSNKSALNLKDFEMMTLEEIQQAEKEIKKYMTIAKTQISRRWRRNDHSSKISSKYTIKKSVKNYGIIKLAFKEQIKKVRPLVILIDISGSMESYSRIMLFLSHILIQHHKNVEVFTFGTKLTRITQFLKNKDVDFMKINNGANTFNTIGESIHGETTLTLSNGITVNANMVLVGNTSGANCVVTSNNSGTTSIRVKDVSLTKFTTGEHINVKINNVKQADFGIISGQSTATGKIAYYDRVNESGNTIIHVDNVSGTFTNGHQIKGQTNRALAESRNPQVFAITASAPE